MFISLHNSYVESLVPNMMIFGDEVFGKQLDLDLVVGVGTSWGNKWPLQEE